MRERGDGYNEAFLANSSSKHFCECVKPSNAIAFTFSSICKTSNK